MKNHAVIKSRKNGMNIIMDPDCPFEEVRQELEDRFKQNAAFWGSARMALFLEGRDLSAEESLIIVNTITENSEVDIICLVDEDEEMITLAQRSIDERARKLCNANADLYRSDMAELELAESDKSLVILGDVAQQATVTAAGNVIVLGELKGNIYAGSPENDEAVVVALTMAPHRIQIGSVSELYRGNGHKLGRGPMMAFCEDGAIQVKPLKKELFGFLHRI